MRELRYSVASSLDGCIAGPHAHDAWTVAPTPEFSWVVSAARVLSPHFVRRDGSHRTLLKRSASRTRML